MEELVTPLAYRLAYRLERRQPLWGGSTGDQAPDLGKRWSRLGESDPGPTHYECVALPTELRRRARRASSEILIRPRRVPRDGNPGSLLNQRP